MQFKTILAFAMVVLISGAVFAQAKPAAKATRPAKTAKADPKASRKEIRVEARNIAAEVRAPLTETELAVAGRVHVGSLPCELGQTVLLEPDAGSNGFFHLSLGKERYHVAPEETTTGAIRLEDKAAGIVWLQLANKSMLMSQKFGKRLADECMSPAQAIVAKAMLLNPPPSVLDTPASNSPAVSAPAKTSSSATVGPAVASRIEISTSKE